MVYFHLHIQKDNEQICLRSENLIIISDFCLIRALMAFCHLRCMFKSARNPWSKTLLNFAFNIIFLKKKLI